MRVILLYLAVAGLLFYSFRDWYKSLCALITMTAVVDHPDMPRSLLGIPGLNVWNAVLLTVLGGWFLSRGRERLAFNPPLPFAILGALYALVAAVASLRMLADPANLPATTTELIVFCVNTLKFVIPGLLLFDGCRSRSRLNFAVLAILAYYFLLAIQVVKWVPPWYALDPGELERRSRTILRREMGFYRTDLSMIMAGAAWAFVAARALYTDRRFRLGLLGASALCTLAVALTAGRAGYLTWAFVGGLFAVLRFRKLLLLLPVVVGLTVWLVPGIAGRLLEGFTSQSGFEEPVDANVVTAGRTDAWPHIIEAIGQAPWIGYGRQAMVTTGLYLRSSNVEGEVVPHPHNLFLELLLDAGWVGFLPVMLLFSLLVVIALRLTVDSRSPLFLAAGGIALAALSAFLFSGFAGRHYYPEENSFAMWCSVGLLLRTWVERNRTQRGPQVRAVRPSRPIEPSPRARLAAPGSPPGRGLSRMGPRPC